MPSAHCATTSFNTRSIRFRSADLRSHVVEMGSSDGARLRARLIAFIDEPQQLADFIQREAEFARPQDEAKPPARASCHSCGSPPSCAAAQAAADLLVVADRLQIAARPPGEFGSLQALHYSVIAHRKYPLTL